MINNDWAFDWAFSTVTGPYTVENSILTGCLQKHLVGQDRAPLPHGINSPHAAGSEADGVYSALSKLDLAQSLQYLILYPSGSPNFWSISSEGTSARREAPASEAAAPPSTPHKDGAPTAFLLAPIIIVTSPASGGLKCRSLDCYMTPWHTWVCTLNSILIND